MDNYIRAAGDRDEDRQIGIERKKKRESCSIKRTEREPITK